QPDFCNPLCIMKTTTLQLRNSVNWSPLRLAFLLIPFACFALSPQVRADCREGCDLGNFNTFLGDDALGESTSGFFNTAIGLDALLRNTANNNTAIGAL